MSQSRSVLLICNDVIKPAMAGPAIRYWEFARGLSRYFTVTLAIPPHLQAESDPEGLNPPFKVCLCQTQAQLQALTRQTEVIITVGVNLSLYPFLPQTTQPLVVDMYIPFMLESLHKYADKPLLSEGDRGAHTLQIRSADFIICASEKQKDYWLGWLSALGRVNPYTHLQDPTLTKLIDTVPFGLPAEAPIHQKQVLKGAYPGIGPDDQVILWGGGLWNWLDPYTLIKAVALISERYPQIKLFFMGVKNPNPAVAQMEAVTRAIELSRELGLYNRQVFFNDWVPYQERQNYLLEADLGVSLHFNHLETRFSFRTRLLDYIWAGLPILTTTGDTLSDEVTRWGLGRVVESGQVEQVSQVLVDMLTTPNLRQAYRPHFEQIRAKYEWETAMAPLIQFCQAPYRAADKPHLRSIPLVDPGVSAWWLWPGKILRLFRAYGPQGVFYKTREYLRWKKRK